MMITAYLQKLILPFMRECYFAVDLGATSGRTILVEIGADLLSVEEVNRFPNHIIESLGHSYWDIYELYNNILDGLRRVSAMKNVHVRSIGIDTWGVDFVMVGKDGHFLRQPYSYRDPHTEAAPEKYFAKVPRETVYAKTGIQVMNFNTLFQIDTLRRNGDCALNAADKILFIPDALSYMLTGKQVTEYTIASTSQLINAETRRFDTDILKSLGLDENNFGEFVYPGQRIGCLSEAVQKLTGLGEVPVIAVAGHDTASAVVAVPARDANFAYLSSGTWSLMGVETCRPVITRETEALNFTNEGGVYGTIRLLKNICGMWLLESCRRKWDTTTYSQLIEDAMHSEAFRSLINPDDALFANPDDMEDAIRRYCLIHGQPVPETRGQIVRCIFESLAFRYREVLDNLGKLSPVRIDVLHIIGGGSCNGMLCQFTSNAIGLPVIAGPAEATAIGNVMVQAMADGAASDMQSMRRLISDSMSLPAYRPENREVWASAYEHYKNITQNI